MGRDVAASIAISEPTRFLGVRYGLTCWLDELFILYSPWERLWNERKLEASLYGTNDRAWRFWEQARLAESRAGSSALEVFYLCVILGFPQPAVPPAAPITFTRSSPRSLLRPSTATLAPAAARPSASAPPSTPVAPMTTATSFEREKS